MMNKIATFMMATSPEVDPEKLPEKLYHGTSKEKYISIMKSGLKIHEVYGQTYFAETAEDVAKFVTPPCVVFEVETQKLDLNFLRLSLDHNKEFYGDIDCYAYYKNIKPKYLKAFELYYEEETVNDKTS
ncbi:RNA 2'-phosphotransferase [Bacillus thuringiensis]|uniref:RNA 2'-phosphotransferase n=1 Tax=Bacillus thuringiensis TaxID=1428 RepID=UPI0021D689AE|nr:RNA 2'-phosphotransferase [Bacillus thuringiensis]MCU7666800.1 RNA 2'-phosphotransferase [Bacillus thuringiensis]